MEHEHCSRCDCEHPQPIYDSGVDKWYCGCCAVVDGVASVMVPCTPEFCGDDVFKPTGPDEAPVDETSRPR